MPTNNLTDILAVVEQVRRDTQPEVDATLLQTIIRIEEANSEDDEAALRAIEKAVTELLQNEEPS